MSAETNDEPYPAGNPCNAGGISWYKMGGRRVALANGCIEIGQSGMALR
jgi:hypothetical protein